MSNYNQHGQPAYAYPPQPQYGYQQPPNPYMYQQQQATYPPPPPATYYPPPPAQNGYVYPDHSYNASQSAPKPTANHGNSPPHNHNGKVPTAGHSNVQINTAPKYQDVWAAILWLLNFAGFIVCLVVGLPYLKDIGTINTDTNSGGIQIFNGTDIGILAGGTAIGGAAISFLYLFLLLKFAGKMIKISMVIKVLLMAAGTVAYFAFGYIVAGIFWALFTALIAWALWSMRFRIPFAKVMLKTVVPIIRKYPATVLTSFIGMVLQVAISITWILAYIGMALHLTKNQSSSGALYAAMVFLAFSFYWTSQVIRYTVHVTVSGLFATYYFDGTSTGAGQVHVATRNPTAAAAKRALTTSFGSICFGGLIIAILQTIHAMLRSAANDAANNGNMAAAICAACAACFLDCLKDIMEYFNRYAFTQVAIYGKGYVDAAKATWRLVKERGIDALINDSLIGTVLSIGAFVASMLGAVYGAIVVTASPRIENTAANYVVAIILCFFVVLVEFTIVVGVVDSGVATTFVCLAEDPRALQRTKPELFEKVRETYPNVMLSYY